MADNTLSESVGQTDGLLPFDAACKRILSEREILARIMRECLSEFEGCPVEDIAWRYIKDDPLVGTVPLQPAPRVAGLRNDEAVPREGRVSYDIRFTAEAPGEQGPIGLMVDVEAQGDSADAKRLLGRAVYYCARMLSSQHGEVFSRSQYELLRKVYSIWICTDPPRRLENTIVRYSMEREDLFGHVEEDIKAADLLSVVVVRLGKPGSLGYTGSVLDLLSKLLSSEVSAREKLRVLEEEYGVALTDDIEGEVALMGLIGERYFSEVRERALREGHEEGRREGMEEGRKEGEAEGRRKGEAEGRRKGEAEGRADTLAASVASLMRTMSWDAERAMDALSIPQEERPECRARLAG